MQEILPAPQATTSERIETSTHQVAFVTQGCKTNLMESSALADEFKALGWDVVPQKEAANLYVFNTCTVTEKADAEARRLIRQLRRRHPQARVAVTGCYAQVSPDTLAAIEGVDFVIGNNFKDDLPRIVTQYFVPGGFASPMVQVDEFEKSRELASPTASFAGLLADGGTRTRGSIKIQDGCDYKCTYCIIWKGRGPSRSLPVSVIQQQFIRMVAEGFKEIVLTGINIGQYRCPSDVTQELPELLAALCQVEGEFRLRLTSLDPLEVTPKLIDVMARSQGKICPHVHLSTQSADDHVLKTMARRHHVNELQAVCQQLVTAMPTVCISSDIIVGFPTETDEAFERTMAVIREIPMHQIHVFRYSPRPGTPAAEMKPQVPERIRKERATRLLQLAEEKKQAYMNSFVGQDVRVLWEKEEGLTDEYLKVRSVRTVEPNTFDYVAISHHSENLLVVAH